MLWHHMIFYFLALLQMHKKHPLLIFTSRTLHILATILIIFLMITAHISSCYLLQDGRCLYCLVSYISVSRSYFLWIHMYLLLENSAQAGMTILCILFLDFLIMHPKVPLVGFDKPDDALLFQLDIQFFILLYEFCYLFTYLMGILSQNYGIASTIFCFHTMGLLCDWKFTPPRIILETTYAVMECSQ